MTTDFGGVLALRPGAGFEPLGVSKVGPMLATPVAVGGRMIFRTFTELVAFAP